MSLPQPITTYVASQVSEKATGLGYDLLLGYQHGSGTYLHLFFAIYNRDPETCIPDCMEVISKAGKSYIGNALWPRADGAGMGLAFGYTMSHESYRQYNTMAEVNRAIIGAFPQMLSDPLGRKIPAYKMGVLIFKLAKATQVTPWSTGCNYLNKKHAVPCVDF